MNGAHVHLLVNHVPVLGLLFGIGLIVYAMVRAQQTVLKAALGILVIAAIGGGIAYKSGEEAEEVLEETIQVDHDVIHEHEEAGEWAGIAGGVVGLLSLIALGMARGKDVPRTFVLVILALGLVASVMVARTAMLGGEIRHTEIRGDALSRTFGGAPAPADVPAIEARQSGSGDSD